MTLLRKQGFSRILFSIFFLLSSLLLLAQQWENGRHVMPVTPSLQQPLMITMNAPADLHSFKFLTQVGGVAFQNIAEPSGRFQQQKFTVHYNKKKPDGERLNIIIEQDTIAADIYDWQLIPIAKYADSQYNACVSLFGPQSTKVNHHIVYHEEFQNTLMGVRLLQADIMLLDMVEFWKAPTYNKETVFGAGEFSHQKNEWKSAAIELQNVLVTGNFKSYVMTDYGEEITFSENHGKLILTGKPYYHFWTIEEATFQTQQQAKSTEIEDLQQRMNQLVDSLNNNQGMAVDQRNSLIDDYNQHVQELKILIDNFNEMEPEVIVLTSLNEKMKAKRDALSKFNPVVYQAATNTMQYSAFFRYIKNANPGNWTKFLNEIDSVEIQPAVLTPTTWKKQ